MSFGQEFIPGADRSQVQPPGTTLDLNERFRRPLMSFFLRRTKDRSEAEDLTQQVFLQILSAKVRGEILNREAFVFRVAANLLRDRHRRQSRRRHGPLVDNLSSDEIAGADLIDFSAERILLGRERLAEVLGLFDDLEARTGEIFFLFRVDKMKQRDIADRFGIGLSTVEKHVMKATRRLRTWQAS